jgi:hypothetical protein
MKEELVAIKNAGLGGVDIFEIGLPPASDPNQIIPSGPAFMGDSSLKAIKFAIDEAGKTGVGSGTQSGQQLECRRNMGNAQTFRKNAVFFQNYHYG